MALKPLLGRQLPMDLAGAGKFRPDLFQEK
jgi:hypothetical protein